MSSTITYDLSFITSESLILNVSINFVRWEPLGILCGSSGIAFDHSERIDSVVVSRILDL